MALTPAERQRRRRERLKKEGTSRRDWILEPDELRMLGEICVLRRPGASSIFGERSHWFADQEKL